MKLAISVVFVLLGSALSASEADSEARSTMRTKAMEKVFARSTEAHKASLNAITRSMTVAKAVRLLEKTPLNSLLVSQVKGHKRFLRQPKGYNGVEGARKMLNDMIFESMEKYDTEIAKCTNYYSEQCAAMEKCRGEIASANYIAANSRELILDSQATINKCEVEIPEKREQLKFHNLKCKHELEIMKNRLTIILGDIEVMVTILEMTDCDKKKFVQKKRWSLLHCKDECTKKSFVMFDNDGLQKAVNKLKSRMPDQLMADTFKDVFAGIEGLKSISFTQTASKRQAPVVNKTKFNNPPIPETEIPDNSCNDPDGGAPSASDKNKATCTLGASPNCPKLQERFLLIQSGFQDERDGLQFWIALVEHWCEGYKKTLETEIANSESMLDAAQTNLAAATEKEATAGETARQTAAAHEQLDADLKAQMKKCSESYIMFETELCALKKIRGELYKLEGAPAVFQDCEVTSWNPGDCSKTCGGGDQELERQVMTQPNKGAKCLPLFASKGCNHQPCPVDCETTQWSGWSKCSAECGGGVEQRLKEVKRAMKFDGKPCGETSETRSCNSASCEKDCDLSDWGKWSSCSKDCDGGTMKRSRFVQTAAQGEGKCADPWSSERLEYKECNMHRCVMPPKGPMICNKTLDIILLIDGSGSLGKTGWDKEIIAAQNTVDAFKDGDSQMAVILYSGPSTWGGVQKCFDTDAEKVDGDEDACKIKILEDNKEPFFRGSDDLEDLKKEIDKLIWPKGSTLTSLALLKAKAVLSTGRQNVKSAIIVFTDGRPLSYRKTTLAARAVRKAARLLWVAIGNYAPLAYIKSWATRRWEENLVVVKTFEDLDRLSTITHVVADLCPSA